MFKKDVPPFTALQFMQSFNRGSQMGMHPLLLWQNQWSIFFQHLDDAFETSVKSCLSKDDWSILVACQMGIGAYRYLQGNHLLEADVSEWSIAPTLRVEPDTIRVFQEKHVAYTEEASRLVISDLCGDLDGIGVAIEKFRDDFL
ncbi:hypothetical protein EV421DRAFT_1743892 [Armillaria borealis]|uniref:Uncharacterized protein n=1 Tax=Armillaria borealis TaxID=47425 RepID=A0AA39IUB1_9AGAR|nr:hypothetical protein EV421DRAFT_1743892 [Armillaria borealis]